MQLVWEECNYTCRSKRFPLLSSRVCLYLPLHCWGDGSRIHSKSEGQRVLAQLKAADSYLKDLDSFCGCHRTWGPAWFFQLFLASSALPGNMGWPCIFPSIPCLVQLGKSFLPCSHTAGSSHWVGHLIHRENIFSDHHLPEEKLLAPKQKNVVSLKFPTRKHNSLLLWTENFLPDLLHATWKARNKGNLGKRKQWNITSPFLCGFH